MHAFEAGLIGHWYQWKCLSKIHSNPKPHTPLYRGLGFSVPQNAQTGLISVREAGAALKLPCCVWLFYKSFFFFFYYLV